MFVFDCLFTVCLCVGTMIVTSAPPMCGLGLLGNDLAGRLLEELALSTGGLNGSTGIGRKGMSLNRKVLGGKVLLSDNDLVDLELGLGNGTGAEKGVDCWFFFG